MLKYENFSETHRLQATVFTPNFIFSTSEALKKVMNLNQDILDGDPTVLPLPADAPMEIPRITIESKDKKFKLEIAPIRINFFRTKINDEDKIKPDEIIRLVISTLTDLLDSLGTQCGRIAIVIDRHSIIPDAGKEIALHFCKKEFIEAPFARPTEFELHSLKKYRYLDRFEVNSWVRVRSAHIRLEGGILRPVVNVHQDINTIAEATEIFSNSEIESFYQNIYDEFDHILELYMAKQ